MRITLTLSGKQPSERALLRQLAALAATQRRPRTVSRTLAALPFTLLEQLLRLGLAGLEALVRRGVMALGRKRTG